MVSDATYNSKMKVFKRAHYVACCLNRLVQFAYKMIVVWMLSFAAIAEDCRLSTPGMDSMEKAIISLVNANGQLVQIRTHIADNNFERGAGYQFICDEVIDSSTILFFFPEPIVSRFHMNNVKTPLDIGFFDQNGELIHYQVMDIYQTEDKPLYGPNLPFQFALEAKVGFFQAHQLIPGKSKLVLAGE